MANYNSAKVNVFPSTHRSSYPTGKFTSENNFVNILNSLNDTDSYVLEAENGGTLKVVIHGYYFEIKEWVRENSLRLGICIETGSNSLVAFTSKSTSTLDDGGNFLGLEKNPSSQTSNENYSYYYLDVTDSSGNIINKYRLNTDSILSGQVDLTTKISSIESSKQDNISPGTGISITNNVVSIASNEINKLNSLNSKGGNNRFVYFDQNGQAISNTTGSAGKVATASDLKSSAMVMVDGEIKTGVTIHASTLNPTSSDGNIGDIWLKYSE